MRTPDDAEFKVTFDGKGRLSIQVSMVGPLHVFKTGRKGYAFRDYVDWGGKKWSIRFQAFLNTRSTETTHGTLMDEATAQRECAKFSSIMGTKFSRYIEAKASPRERNGWVLAKSASGVQAQFDFDKLGALKSGKVGSFASFYIEIDSLEYLGQFHLKPKHEAARKPTEWDWSKGARAGLPTLGKRR